MVPERHPVVQINPQISNGPGRRDLRPDSHWDLEGNPALCQEGNLRFLHAQDTVVRHVPEFRAQYGSLCRPAVTRIVSHPSIVSYRSSRSRRYPRIIRIRYCRVSKRPCKASRIILHLTLLKAFFTSRVTSITSPLVCLFRSCSFWKIRITSRTALIVEYPETVLIRGESSGILHGGLESCLQQSF